MIPLQVDKLVLLNLYISETCDLLENIATNRGTIEYSGRAVITSACLVSLFCFIWGLIG